MKLSTRRLGLIGLSILLLAAAGYAQRRGGRGGGGFGARNDDDGPHPVFPDRGEFHFIRGEYNDLPQYHRGFGFASRDAQGSGWWLVDWPDADEHFSVGIGRLTRIDVAQPLHMRLMDDRIFDNPWIYITQAGWWNLSDQEILRLREYLTRGGFLMTDDFWGPDTEEWQIFSSAMHRALPGHPISDISENDPSMHVLYDIREKDRTFIPGSRHLRRGASGQIMVQQPFGTTPAWRAMYDDKNRMVVAANYNTDIGDAWEWADSPIYPEQMTALAYRYGINYIIYAMTH